MYNNVKKELFDGIIKSALTELINEELTTAPSDEELAGMYPIPKRSLRIAKRKMKERAYRKPLPLVYLQRVAIAVLVIISVSFGVLATNEGVRDAITDAVVTWYEDHVRFDFSKSDKEPEPITKDDGEELILGVYDLSIGYIPEGFEEASRTEDSGFRQYIYYKDNGEHLLIVICDSKYTEMEQDSEQHEYEEIILNGNIKAHMFYNDEERSGTIIYGNNEYTVDVTGIIDKEELIKVAENILPADDNTKKNDDYASELKIGYIPDGFEALDIMETVGMRQYTYYNENGEYIYIEISGSESTEVMLDVENHEYEEIDINDNIAYLTYDESDRSGSLVFGNKAYTVLISVILDKDELIKVAENILPADGDSKENYEYVAEMNIGYVPEGYELTSSTEDTNLREYIYVSESGDYLIISICTTETTEILAGAKDGEYEEMSINGNDAYIVYSDADRTGTLVFGNVEYTIMISAICDRDELIKVAESIK